jgi:hypothetical protein
MVFLRCQGHEHAKLSNQGETRNPTKCTCPLVTTLAVLATILAGIIVAVLATAFAHALFATFLAISLEGLQAANSQIVGNCASIGRSFPHPEYL